MDGPSKLFKRSIHQICATVILLVPGKVMLGNDSK